MIAELKRSANDQLQDRNHGPHWEGGTTKKHVEQIDPAGRRRLWNHKVKVDK